MAIADGNGGTRAAGTPGYDASAAYVASTLRAAGYLVTEQPFEFDFWQQTGPSTLAQLTPQGETYTEGADYLLMEYSGAADVTAPVAAAGGIVIPSPGGSTSGCTAADFAGFPAGAVALVQRGTCTFEEKALNAKAAGASAVIIFNGGDSADREGLINGTAGSASFEGFPVLDATFALGQTLHGLIPQGLTLRVVAQTHVTFDILTTNVLAENRVRFAFWGAKESGLIGSQFYVDQLSARDIKNIAVHLNFDMVGSPNFVRFVYDGDGSAFGVPGPNGSKLIEHVFVDYFASLGLATEPTEFDGRSDNDAFINVGIPAGGLFTGAEGIKTPAQAAVYGGTAGLAYDPATTRRATRSPTTATPGSTR